MRRGSQWTSCPHAVAGVDGYDTVIVGGAPTPSAGARGARRFVRRHAARLRQRPVYFFSSGPLDDSATHTEVPPVKGVGRLMRRVDARGHVTFGGRLSPDAKGFAASAMAKKNAGDWRDPAHVREWVASIAPGLRTRVAHGV